MQREASQLPMVTEALLVNGPGEGKRVSCLFGEHFYKYERDGEEPVLYRLAPFAVRRHPRRDDMGLDIYRVGFVGDAPADARLRELIKENAFAPYHLHFPKPRR